MATTITAGNATNGAAISSDNTGTLNILTGPGAGTTAISINTSQAVTIPGNLTVSGTFSAPGVGGNYILNQYVAPATWTKPANLKAIKVTVVGAGGTGGPASGVNNVGGGGGGGGATISYLPAPSIPGPVAVTAGAGTNSFGAFCSATAGSNAATGYIVSAGAAGGAGSSGTVNFNGSGGSFGHYDNTNTLGMGGAGGPSILGGGGRSVVSPSPVTGGQAGGNYGGGGSGGSVNGTSGGSGAPGIVIVEEFY